MCFFKAEACLSGALVLYLKHAFSVEMNSKVYVKNISISDEAHDLVLFEWDLGELIGIQLVEADVLEFTGLNGVLRVSVTKEKLLNAKVSSQNEPKLQCELLNKME
jgi:hypothetical protein